MQLNKKIVLSVAMLLLIPLVTVIYGQNIHQPIIDNQQLVGMTIFNANSFYAQDNSITVQNGFTTIQNNDNTPVLSARINPPQYTESKLNKLKTPLKRIVLVVVKVSKANPKTNTPMFIECGNSPYGNNSFYIGANNSIGVVPTTSNTSTKNIHPVCHFDEGEIPFAKSLIAIEKKQSISSHEITFKSTNYSKTSRIRPPPIS